jgi:adenosylcobyric acid synthase
VRGALLVAGTGSDAGKSALVAAPGTDFAALRQARLDVLGDLVADHLDTGALSRLISGGPPPGMPSLLVSLKHDR